MIIFTFILSFIIHKNQYVSKKAVDQHLNNQFSKKSNKKLPKAQYQCDLSNLKDTQCSSGSEGWTGWDGKNLSDSVIDFVHCQNGNVVLQGNGLCGYFSTNLDRHPSGLFKIENSNFECSLNIFYATAVMSKTVQLIHFIGSGTHTITGTEFRWCGRNAFKFYENNKDVPQKGTTFPEGWDPCLILADGNSQNTITNSFFSHPKSGSVQGFELYNIRCLRFKDQTTLNLRNTNFYNATARNGGSFLLLESIGSTNIEDCRFDTCQDNADIGHAIQVNLCNIINIRRCTFIDCGKGVGSVIRMNYHGLVLEDSQISFTNSANSCRCVYCKPRGIYKFKRNTFSNAKVTYEGDTEKWRSTVLHIECDGDNYEQIEIKDNVFDNIGGDNQGRCIYAIVKTNTFTAIKNNTIQNCPSGLFYFKIIFNVKISSFTLDSCKFKKNTVTGKHGGGGGLWIQHEVNSQLLPYVLNIVNCEFIENHSQEKGGGFHIGCDDDGDINGNGRFQTLIEIDIKDSTFNGNTAVKSGGAIAVQTNQPLKIENCHFINNRANGNADTALGGAIYIQTNNVYLGTTVIMPEATIVSCDFQLNYALNGHILYFSGETDTEIKFSNCDFIVNYQNRIINGAGSIISYVNKLSFDSCTFKCSSSSSDW